MYIYIYLACGRSANLSLYRLFSDGRRTNTGHSCRAGDPAQERATLPHRPGVHRLQAGAGGGASAPVVGGRGRGKVRDAHGEKSEVRKNRPWEGCILRFLTLCHDKKA